MAARAAARDDDQTACEAWLLAGESTAAADVRRAEGMFYSALALAERRPMAALRARALAALGSLDVLRVGSSERVALAREAALDAGMAALAAASTHDLAMLGVLRVQSSGRRPRLGGADCAAGTPLPARVGARRRTDQARVGRRPYRQL